MDLLHTVVNKPTATCTPFSQIMMSSTSCFVGDQQVYFGGVPVDVEQAEVPEIPKPPYSYVALIVLAIDALKGKATLSQIYKFIEAKFDYYRLVAKRRGWQNSIRHNLSLNRNCFMKVSRDGFTAPDGRKGNYWSLQPGISLHSLFEEGNCKRRKRIAEGHEKKMRKQIARRAQHKKTYATGSTPSQSTHSRADHAWGPSLQSQWCLQQLVQGTQAQGGTGEPQFMFPWGMASNSAVTYSGSSFNAESRALPGLLTNTHQTPLSSTTNEVAMSLIRQKYSELGVAPASHSSQSRRDLARTWRSGSDQSVAHVNCHLLSPVRNEANSSKRRSDPSTSTATDWDKCYRSLDLSSSYNGDGTGLSNLEASSSRSMVPDFFSGLSSSDAANIPSLFNTFLHIKSEPRTTHTPSCQNPTCRSGDQLPTPNTQQLYMGHIGTPAPSSSHQQLSMDRLWRSFEMAGCFPAAMPLNSHSFPSALVQSPQHISNQGAPFEENQYPLHTKALATDFSNSAIGQREL